MKKAAVALVIVLTAMTVAHARDWPEGMPTPDPTKSTVWENVKSRYDGLMGGTRDYQEYWSPPGFRHEDFTYNAFGFFVEEKLWRTYQMFDVNYFRFDTSLDRWILHRKEPVEAHRLYFTESDQAGVVLMDYKRYGAPFNSNVHNEDGVYTIVSNYRRDDGSVFTITYQSFFEVNDAHFVRRLAD